MTFGDYELAFFRQALSEAGLSDGEFVIPGDFSREAGWRAILKILQQVPRPTAIFAANDKMAMGCLAGLRENGIAVPEAMSLVGFGDVPSAEDTVPPLTTVAIPLREVGRQAMRQVLRQLAGDLPESMVVPSTLAVRRSASTATSDDPP